MEGASAVAQAILGLAAVLGLLYALAWGAKRLRLAQGTQPALLRSVAGLSVGTRERVVVLEVGDTWLVLGVTPQSINTLHTLPKTGTDAPKFSVPVHAPR